MASLRSASCRTFSSRWSMRGRDFFQTTDFLLRAGEPQHCESHHRTTIGRCYYAVFLSILEAFTPSLDGPLYNNALDHDFALALVERLLGERHADATGFDLLRNWRRVADYKPKGLNKKGLFVPTLDNAKQA